MYNGLPIITNKVTIDEQRGIPHHLLGFIALDEEPWRVGLFKRKANRIIEEIRSRGRIPILVGGTHYYTQTLLFEDTLVTEEADGVNQNQIDLSNEEIAKKYPILDGPPEAVLQRLKEIDPVMAERWHPGDVRKIRRSLEIFLLTGRKASDIYEEQKRNKIPVTERSEDSPIRSENVAASTLLFWVHSDSEILRERLDRRIDTMMERGLLEEVKSMNEFIHTRETEGIAVDRTRGIWVSIGFKEFEPYLTALASGPSSQKDLDNLLAESIEKTKAATRQYAKRQTRWIRLKLLPALPEQNSVDNLFLLDGTDIIQWNAAVSEPAIKIAEAFLAGEQLPAPSSVCDAAKKHLALEKSDESIGGVRHECDLCHTITVTEGQWEAHLKSRTHRRMIKKSLQAPNRGRSSPPESTHVAAPAETP